jgi:MFS transporter, Spinster family, sphingosine-1-phosphate transporter
MPQLGQRGVIALLCYINLINYIDRGIIPGAPESFQVFMTKTLGISPSEQNFYLGLLSSAFIAATALFSLIFGYLAISYKPFTLIAYGMSSWVIAVVLCGASYYWDSYALLLFGRVLSGVGEASFHCNAMPFINRNAPQENSTLWLGIFIASITVGMAAGYVYGSIFASSSLGWAWAFFLEALLMAPPVVACIWCIPDDLNAIPEEEEAPSDLTEELLTRVETPSLVSVGTGLARPVLVSQRSTDKLEPFADHEREPNADSGKTIQKESFLRQSWRVFKNVPFSLVAFGHAAYTFSLASFSVFAPILLIGLGFFETETSVSLVFGGVIVVAGTIGTVVGALALDRMTQGNSVSREQRCQIAVDHIFYFMIAGLACGLIMMVFTNSKFWFLLWLAVTFFFMSAIGPGETVAAMELFPVSRQALAVAANTVVILVFGDVPSPVILGWLKDTWAPRCGTIEVHGLPKLNPECHLDHGGLHGVLLFAVLWLVWAVLLWGFAKFVLRNKQSVSSTSVVTIESPVADR